MCLDCRYVWEAPDSNFAIIEVDPCTCLFKLFTEPIGKTVFFFFKHLFSLSKTLCNHFVVPISHDFHPEPEQFLFDPPIRFLNDDSFL